MADREINGLLGAVHLSTTLTELYGPAVDKQVQGMIEITGLDTVATVYFGIIVEDASNNQFVKNEHISISRGQTKRHPIGIRESASVKVYCETQDAIIVVSATTKADPCVCTISVIGTLSNGDVVEILAMDEMTELNGNIYKVNNVTSTTCELQTLDGIDLDSSGFGTAESTGGTMQKIPADIILMGHEEDVPQQ